MRKLIGITAAAAVLALLALAALGATARPANASVTATTKNYCMGGTTTVSFFKPDRSQFPDGSYGDYLYGQALATYYSNVSKYDHYVNNGGYYQPGGWVDGQYVPGHWVTVTSGDCPAAASPPVVKPQTNGVKLCYSVGGNLYTTTTADQGAALMAVGYWTPSAVGFNSDGTPVLACLKPGTGLGNAPAASAYTDNNGDMLSPAQAADTGGENVYPIVG